jgi:hypothetical protein
VITQIHQRRLTLLRKNETHQRRQRHRMNNPLRRRHRLLRNQQNLALWMEWR